jgi:hypothetical protein
MVECNLVSTLNPTSAHVWAALLRRGKTVQKTQPEHTLADPERNLFFVGRWPSRRHPKLDISMQSFQVFWLFVAASRSDLSGRIAWGYSKLAVGSALLTLSLFLLRAFTAFGLMLMEKVGPS